MMSSRYNVEESDELTGQNVRTISGRHQRKVLAGSSLDAVSARQWSRPELASKSKPPRSFRTTKHTVDSATVANGSITENRHNTRRESIVPPLPLNMTSSAAMITPAEDGCKSPVFQSPTLTLNGSSRDTVSDNLGKAVDGLLTNHPFPAVDEALQRPSSRVLFTDSPPSAREQLLSKEPLSARGLSARKKSPRVTGVNTTSSARRPSEATMEIVETPASARASGKASARASGKTSARASGKTSGKASTTAPMGGVPTISSKEIAKSPRLQAAMDKMFGHHVSSDEESSSDHSDNSTHFSDTKLGCDSNRSHHSDRGDDLDEFNSSRVVFAIETVLQSDPSDDGGCAVGTSTTTTSSSDISGDSIQQYAFPALRSARDSHRALSTDVHHDKNQGGMTALARVRRASSIHQRALPFVSVYVDELPFGAYVALFFQRNNLNARLSKKSKLFYAVEVYSSRLSLDDIEHYDECMAKVPYTEMVYNVDRISMEQISVRRIDSDDTVDMWFEMTSASSQGMYVRVAATYKMQRSNVDATLVAIEFRLMHDVDTVVAYRSFGGDTIRHQKMPPIFFTPQLFANEAPRIAGCMPLNKKNKVAVGIWNALRVHANKDWETYVALREQFVQDYSSLVDRASKVEAVPRC